MTNDESRRLRVASVVFNLSIVLIIIAPTVYQLGQRGIFWVFNACLILGGWAIFVMARDPRLRVLMAFGSRSNREAVARAPKVLLDELDFHLRGEAFRLSYQLVAALVALVSIAGFLIFAFTEIRVDWNRLLMLTFPFGILWLLALPTTVLVWISNPIANE